MSYMFLFDESKCVACGACAVACMDQNDIDTLAGDTPFRNCFVDEQGPVDAPKFTFMSVACMHCDPAPCIAVCPNACLKKDEKTGFTIYDNTDCIGCRRCAEACPGSHPRFNGGTGKMSKCDGCVERVKRGMKPACVKACPFGALQLVSKNEH